MESKRKMDEDIYREKARQNAREEEYNVLIDHQELNLRTLTDFKNQSKPNIA